jgi:carbamoyl-phosphate synthase large subunit
MADSFGLAFFKSQEATKTPLPLSGTVLITIGDRDKNKIVQTAQNFRDMGFKIMATKGTKEFLNNHGIESQFINKIYENRPNIIDALVNREIDLVVNTPAGKLSEYDDSYIRKNAIKYNVPYITTTSAAFAATQGIKERRNGAYHVKSLQDYHKEIN